MIGAIIANPLAEDSTFMGYDKDLDRIEAIYFTWRDDNTGYFTIHYIPMDYVGKLLKEGKLEDTADVSDFLYGDASNCPTEIADSGTEDFDTIAIDCMYQRDVVLVPYSGDMGFILGVWRATR